MLRLLQQMILVLASLCLSLSLISLSSHSLSLPPPPPPPPACDLVYLKYMCMCSISRISPSWARAGSKKTMCLLDSTTVVKQSSFIHSFIHSFPVTSLQSTSTYAILTNSSRLTLPGVRGDWRRQRLEAEDADEVLVDGADVKVAGLLGHLADGGVERAVGVVQAADDLAVLVQLHHQPVVRGSGRHHLLGHLHGHRAQREINVIGHRGRSTSQGTKGAQRHRAQRALNVTGHRGRLTSQGTEDA